jgi:hypothetical protein
LNQKKEFFKLTDTKILDVIKKDREKEILINNILYINENPESGFFLISYEEKNSSNCRYFTYIVLETNTNTILNS